VSLRPSFVLARWRPLISESLVYAAATALGVVYFRVVVVGVSLLAPANEAGYFDTAFRILDIINSVPSLLLISAFPIMARAARDDPQRLRYILQRLFEGSLIVGGWLSLCVVMGAPFAIAVLRAHEQSIGILRIIGAGVPATFLVYVGSFMLLSLRRYRTLMTINAVIVVVAIGLCAILIGADHAHGAAFVTLLLELLLSGSYFAVIVVQRPDLRPSLAQLPRIAAAIGIAFAAALPLSDHAVLAVLAGSAALLAALLILRAMPDEIIVALRRWHPGS
jgi:O-antigen/teichoic acid export membrane protein